MARYTFGAGSGDTVVQAPAPQAPVLRPIVNSGAVGTFWSDQFNGTQYTDLLDAATLTPITGLSTDQYGRVKRFQGPDGVMSGWVDFGAGRFFIAAYDGVFTTGDNNIAGYIGTAGSATRGALDGRYPRAANLLVNCADEGVPTTGDATTALRNAIAKADSLGALLYMPPGMSVTVTDTIEFHGMVWARGATVTINDTTKTAIRYGKPTAYTRGKVAFLPDVTQGGKTGTGWSGTDLGVEILNVLESEIHIGHVTNFSTNVRLNALAGFSTCYNEITVGYLNNGKINLLIHPQDDSAWCNQNTFIGGRWDIAANEGTAVAGTRHVAIRANATTTASTPDNNQFYGACFEGNGPEYHLETMGQYSAFRDCRWETNSGVLPKVWWNSTKSGGIGAVRNIIDGGFYAHAIVQTTSAESTLNVVRSQTWTFGVDYNNGKISWGPGGSGPYDMTLTRSAANTLSVNGGSGNLAGGSYAMANGQSVYCAANSLSAYMKPGLSSGVVIGRSMADGVTAVTSQNNNSGSTGRIHEFANSSGVVAWVGNKGAIGSGTSTTAARPAASSVPAGGRFYDTTLSKPIWSDGTTWRDAMGTAV